MLHARNWPMASHLRNPMGSTITSMLPTRLMAAVLAMKKPVRFGTVICRSWTPHLQCKMLIPSAPRISKAPRGPRQPWLCLLALVVVLLVVLATMGGCSQTPEYDSSTQVSLRPVQQPVDFRAIPAKELAFKGEKAKPGWPSVVNFTRQEFDHYAPGGLDRTSAMVVLTMDEIRTRAGCAFLPPSTRRGMWRDGHSDSKTSRHYAKGRLSDAMDAQPVGCSDLRMVWLRMLSVPQACGIGIYFDESKRMPLIHVDNRSCEQGRVFWMGVRPRPGVSWTYYNPNNPKQAATFWGYMSRYQ